MYEEVLAGLLDLHKYSIEGEEDEEKAELVREEGERLWPKLTNNEREKLSQMSINLWEISDFFLKEPVQMTNVHLVWVLNFYHNHLTNLGYKEIQNEKDLHHRDLRLDHCVWMCTRAVEFVASNTSKAMRWLGYIQGCLHCYEIFTLEELKNHSRSNP